MRSHAFRNRVGDLVDVQVVPASEAKSQFSSILDRVAAGPVAISRHDKPRAVVISIEEFEALAEERESSLAALESEFDGLLSDMQSPKARKGIAAAFAASPSELGKSAARAAKAGRSKR